MNRATKIVAIDDEESILKTLQMFLNAENYDVQIYTSSLLALEEITSMQPAPDIILTDMRMPELDGISLIRKLREREIQSEILVLTAYADEQTALEAIHAGAYDYLTKPYNLDELKIVIDRAAERHKLIAENQSFKETTEASSFFATDSAAMLPVRQMINSIAQVDASVLITGESGVGKEVVAKTLWKKSGRSEGPFVAVNCGAIPEQLVESELFGHVKGSFTGAQADKIGLFQQADKGTIFLDEFGELSLANQVKLLRVLQDQMIRPVGSTKEIQVDVRVICATNQDLEHMIEEGTFRQDLYYRVNVVHIAIPPLRERREDILPLAEHFALQAKQKYGKPDFRFSEEQLLHLEHHNFPGNIRELQNWVERAVLLGDSAQKPTNVSVDDILDRAAEQSATAIIEQRIEFDDAIANFARLIAEHALENHDGNTSATSKALRLTPRQLRYKLKKTP